MRLLARKQESSLGVPYDIAADYYHDQGKKVSVVKNKSGAMSGSFIIEKGTSYEISDLYEFGQGAVSFLVEAYDNDNGTFVYSWVTYDSKREAMKEGWRL